MDRAALNHFRLVGIPIAFAILFAQVSCSRRDFASGDRAAPSASVVTLSVGLGTCDDVQVCEKECSGGSADRCQRLAATHALGRGVAKNETLAEAIYVRACDMDDAASCVFAGQMTEYARGVPKDDAAAARFYKRACDLKWAAGCYNFAIMLEAGRGVPRDLDRAGQLYEVACSAGAHQACNKTRD